MRTPVPALALFVFACGADPKLHSVADAAHGSAEPAPSARIPPQRSIAKLSSMSPATWPTAEDFQRVRSRFTQPYSLVPLVLNAQPVTAIAYMDEDTWTLDAVVGGEAQFDGCKERPCAWPAALDAQRPQEAPPKLSPQVLDAITYAQTLIDFEGPLNIEGEEVDDLSLPEGVWSLAGSTDNEPFPDLRPHLEDLRRYHPRGRCSMDGRPQSVALLRAVSAAQSGKTGWALQGWFDAVAYWSSQRVAASNYGAQHPSGHLNVLEALGVDPGRLFLGLLLRVPGRTRSLSLADAQRVAPDFGAEFVEQLRALAADPTLDPFNQAILVVTTGSSPFRDEPLYAQLPLSARSLLDAWDR